MKKLLIVACMLVSMVCLAGDRLDSKTATFSSSITITNTVGKETASPLKLMSFTLTIPVNVTANTTTFSIMRSGYAYLTITDTFVNNYVYYFENGVVILPTDTFTFTNSVSSNCYANLNYRY